MADKNIVQLVSIINIGSDYLCTPTLPPQFVCLFGFLCVFYNRWSTCLAYLSQLASIFITSKMLDESKHTPEIKRTCTNLADRLMQGENEEKKTLPDFSKFPFPKIPDEQQKVSRVKIYLLNTVKVPLFLRRKDFCSFYKNKMGRSSTHGELWR